MSPQGPYDLYSVFMLTHPNSTESYIPTPSNVARWKYHVDLHEARQMYMDNFKPYETEHAQWAITLMDSRRIDSFDQFPPNTKRIYIDIANRFPGVQVYACGSRVKGDWIVPDCGDDIKEMRKALNKAEKQSDYDFVIPSFTTEERYEALRLLPYGYDLLIFGVPDDEMIPIPMWDFDKLPDDQHQIAIDHFNAQNWGALMAMHNLYQLSPAQFCCQDAPVIKWFKWAIETGKIKSHVKGEVSEHATV